MDEPFTYIDDMSAKDILKKMFDFVGKDRSIIYITRSVNLLEMFDRVYFFEKGKIVEFGSLNELKKKKGKFYQSILKEKKP